MIGTSLIAMDQPFLFSYEIIPQKKLLHMLQCKGKKLLGVKRKPEAAKRNSRL